MKLEGTSQKETLFDMIEGSEVVLSIWVTRSDKVSIGESDNSDRGEGSKDFDFNRRVDGDEYVENPSVWRFDQRVGGSSHRLVVRIR